MAINYNRIDEVEKKDFSGRMNFVVSVEIIHCIVLWFVSVHTPRSAYQSSVQTPEIQSSLVVYNILQSTYTTTVNYSVQNISLAQQAHFYLRIDLIVGPWFSAPLTIPPI